MPLFSSADAEDYYKTATAVRKKDDDAAATEVFVAEACEQVTSVSKIIRLQYTGVTLWFNYLVDYLGQALVAYFHRVIEKVEKLEYYD